MPTAAATTHNVKSSREPVRATCQRIHGKRRRPTTSMSTTNTATWPSVNPSVFSNSRSGVPSVRPLALPPSHADSEGSNTRTRTITRSSTTSQPTVMRPLMESRTPRSSSVRRTTTVLATERARPNTIPAPKLQPQKDVITIPSAVATAIWAIAPGNAIRRTANKSSKEKCKPTPNINSMTPISASWRDSSTLATKPGVAGPSNMPAIR